MIFLELRQHFRSLGKNAKLVFGAELHKYIARIVLALTHKKRYEFPSTPIHSPLHCRSTLFQFNSHTLFTSYLFHYFNPQATNVIYIHIWREREREREREKCIFNPLNSELNPICYLLALLGAHHFLHISRIRVKLLTFRLLMSYIYI